MIDPAKDQRLIEAAPELYAVLKELLDAWYESDGAYGTVALGVRMAGDGPLIDRGRAVIAAVEGQG